MTAGEIKEFYGPVKYRVDYVINGQPASRVIFETLDSGTFAGVTFINGVAIGLEDRIADARLTIQPSRVGD